MVLGTERLKAAERPVWPNLPETPRYEYLGQLLGARNFRLAGDDSLRTTQGFLFWLAGIDPETGLDPERNRNLQRPVSGCVDRDGRILVSDMGHQAIFVFDPLKGEFAIWRYALGNQHFRSPVGVAVGPAGEFFVADAELGVVVRLDGNGTPLGMIGRGVLKRPTGVAWNGARDILYVSDTDADQIKLFDRQGQFIKAIGQPGEEPGQFNSPTHLTFAHERLYVADTLNARIQVFDEEGVFVRAFGRRGWLMGNMVRPKGVAVDNEGNVYVVESFHDHLLIYDREGHFLLPIGGTGNRIGEFYLPNGVWSDAGNRLFVADMFNGRVLILQFLGGDG
ncbi:MAG: 6-bladed beta-propeller [Magnetococcales bacterium]|nr:6-bladed beta-propeller [Magnetococcales bacterium]